MEITTKDIINIYSRRISLFQDLLECVIRERDNLINQDIKGIWSSLEEKQSIMESIEETRHPLKGVTERDVVNRDMPEADREKILELSRNLIRLKQEIRTRVRENVSFINEALGFFNDIISVMTSDGDDGCDSYGPYKNFRRGQKSMMYRGEV